MTFLLQISSLFFHQIVIKIFKELAPKMRAAN